MKTQILKSKEITCGHCARTIKNSLKPIPGIQEVEVDIPRQEIRLTFDETRIDRLGIEAILDGEGYPVERENIPVNPVQRNRCTCRRSCGI